MKIALDLIKRLAARDKGRTVPAMVAPAPLLMALEPRIVYDASVAAVGAGQHHAELGMHKAVARPTSEHAHEIAAVAGNEAASHSTPLRTLAQPARDAGTGAQVNQVVFFDSSVANYQQLIGGLPKGTTYVVLNSSSDGLAQMVQYLQLHPGVEAIHLVSHGQDGAIQVGATWLTQSDLAAHQGELAQIGAAMKPGGDFLIYGCDVAQKVDGQALLQQIASISRLNVAASIDATGAAALGGNWTLEYDVGVVHTSVVFSKASEQQFADLLGVTDETYDSQIGYVTTGGATGVTAFTLDGITYTFDQATEFAVDSTTVNQFGPPPLSTGSSDGVLFGNVQGTALTSMTMTLSDGNKMTVQSFDIDINAPSIVAVEALDGSGNVIATDTLNTANNGGSSTFHVNLSTNASFANIKSLKFVETDSAFLTPTLNNFTYVDLSSPPTLTATSGSTSFVEGDNTASTPVAVDSGITLADGDATTAKQGTVQITGNFASGQDVLGFSNTSATQYGDISASYSASTGLLTLSSASGTASIAQWQNAFRAVTYTDTAVTPSTATRTMSFELLSDAYNSPSNTVTKAVTVTATDQTPIVSTTGSTVSYRAGTSATTIDSSVSVSDLDNTTQTSGTVSVSTGFHSGDTLAFSNTSSTQYGNIAGSYNAATGVLTLTSAGATATDAQWAHALSAVTFSSTSTTYGNRTVSFATSDGSKTSTAANDTVDVTNPVLVTTDSGSAAFVAGDNTTSTPVVVDSGLTVSDTLATTLGSATVAITGGFQSREDVLLFSNDGSTMGNIVGSYNSTTGVLALSSSGATATVAQWQSALDAVKYTDTAVTPNNTTRTISFSVVDSASNTSNTATRTVTVTDTDQTPIVTTTGGTTGYVGGSAAVNIDGGVSVSDLDNTTQVSGTVSVSSGFHSGDTLSFINTSSALYGNVVASYNAATGVLTLTSSGATASDGQWANALRAVSFSSTSTTYGNRTISFATSDGTKTSPASIDTISMTAPPKITTDAGSAAFVAADNTTSTPVAIDSGLTVTDGSATTFGSTTVAITGGFHSSEDLLLFSNDGSTMGNIVGSYNNATGVMTLTSSGSTATLAQWQSALQAVKYTDTAVTPNTATRTISFTGVDGAGNTSATATRTVTVTDTDQSPIVTTTGGTTSYVGASAGVTIDGHVTVSDRDNSTQTSATVAVTTGFQSGDVLSFTNDGATMGNIQGSYSAGSGVLLLTSIGGTATNAQWASAFSSVTFSSTSTTYGNRTIWYQVNDGTKNSAQAADTVYMTAPPKITTDAGSAAFVAGDNTTSTPVAIDAGLTVTDGSATTLASTTVAITGGFHSGEDSLLFTNDGATMGNIVGSYNGSTGVMTLTSSGSTATLAQWQSALQAVQYTDTAVTPNNATRTISFTVTDGAGNTSATATRTVTVTDTDQTPIVATTGGTTNYIGGTSAATIDSGVNVSDRDNSTQAFGTVSITTGFHAGDTLTFVNTSAATYGNIVGSYNAATGVLTLTSSGATSSDRQWANALSAVRFSAGSSAVPGNRTVSFVVNDGTKSSTAAIDTVDVLGPPSISTDAGSASFVAGDNTASTPVAIDSGLSITDGAAPTLASATVAITGGFHSGEDVLGFANTNSATFGNIAASYNASTGVLTLTSSGTSATLAQWQAALEAVTYTDTAITPNTATRTISFTAVDTSATTSNTATRTVTVADTDQTPIVTTARGTTNYVGGTTALAIDRSISVTDRDNTTQSASTVSITAGFHSGDTLSFVNTSSVSFGNIVGSYNAGTGVLTLVSSGATASDAQWSNALSSVTFSAGATATPGNRTISFTSSDGTKTSAVAIDTVDVLGPPTLTADAGSASFVAGDNTTSTPVAVDPGLTVTDGAASTLASAAVSITGGLHAGEDLLGFVNNSASMGNISASYNASTGVLTLSSAGATATLAQWQSALDAVTYTDTAITPNTALRTISFTATDASAVSSNTVTRSVTVADTDQTPIVTTSGGAASFVAGDNTASTPVVIDAGLALSDRDNTTLASAMVAITGNFRSGEDVLAFHNDGATMGNITASYNAATGVLTLTSSGATATLAQWQAALASITYTDTLITPSNATRTISFTVNDGVDNSVAAARTVTVTDTDQTPVVTTSVGGAAFVAGDNTTSTPVVIDNGVILSDRDNATLASATVAITGNFRSGEDVLAFANDGATMGNIAASYNAATGVLTLSSAGATASLAQWQAALDSVTYTDTAITPSNATRTVSFSVNDGVKNSASASRSITITDTDQTPVATTSSGNTSFVAGDNVPSTPVSIDSGITLSDRDNSTLASATVAINGGFHSGQDVLAFNNDGAGMGNISAAYDAAHGVLTLTSTGGTATLAQWQAALRSITYTDTAITPDTATRSIGFTINDGLKNSAVTTRTVTVADVDQTPVVTASAGSVSFGGVGHTGPVTIDPGITVSDRDNATLASATVSISGGFRAGEDVLAFANDGASMGNISASYNSATGVLSLTSSGATATLAQWQAALASVSYADTSLTAAAGSRTVAFVVADGTVDSAAAMRSITVNAGFKGSTFVPTAPSVETVSFGAPSAVNIPSSAPAVLDALVPEPLLSAAMPVLHTDTFTSRDAVLSGLHNVPGMTQVNARPWTAVEAIATPFNVPIVTTHESATPGSRFTVGLTQWVGEDARLIGVTQADGRALPSWVQFDARTGQLHGHLPTHGHRPHALRLLVATRDQQGHQLYREVVLDFGADRATHAKPHRAPLHAAGTAKPSLSEQFERERRSFHVVRSTPLRQEASAMRPSAPAAHT